MVFDLLVKGRGDIVDEEHSVLKAAMSLDRLIETQEISAPTVNQISRYVVSFSSMSPLC